MCMECPTNTINIGVADKDRNDIAKKLSVLLATDYMFFTKAYKYHWNVRSPFFSQLHALFETLYEAHFASVDEIAERIRTLGHEAPGTLAEFIEQSIIEETPGFNPSECFMLAELLGDLETIIQQMRKDLSTIEKSDIISGDLLVGKIKAYEKEAWFLRSHLEIVEDECEDEEEFSIEEAPKKASKKK